MFNLIKEASYIFSKHCFNRGLVLKILFIILFLVYITKLFLLIQVCFTNKAKTHDLVILF